MKEFTLEVDNVFRRGLRSDSREEHGLHTLVECVNLKPIEVGLVPYEVVSDPFKSGEFSSNSITVTPPFPQVFRGQDITLLADLGKIYSVDESDWSLTLLGDGSGKFVDVADVYGSTVSLAAVADGGWHFIDWGNQWYLINGKTVVFQSNLHNLSPDDTTNIFVNNDIDIQTGVRFKGRTVIGGFDSANFWNNDWNDMFTKWKQGRTSHVSIGESISSNYIMWSSIGGGDFPLWLFFPELGITGNLKGSSTEGYRQPKNPIILDMVRRNEFGFMPMPWQGTVRVIKPLGDNLIVYGDNGITAIKTMLEPVPTLVIASKISSEFGIVGRGAVDGDHRGHVFINEDGYVYSISPDLQLKRLGYREFFTSLNATRITVRFDPDDQEFYLGDFGKGYLLSKEGMGETTQSITSLVMKDGTLSGVFNTIGVATAQVVIDIGNLRAGAIKSIENVYIDYSGSATITVAIDYRYDSTSAFTRTAFFPVNKEGMSFPKISGTFFRIIIKASAFGDLTNLSGCNFNVKFGDKRYKRGVGASAITA